jgi:hypothetical protein
MFGANPARWTFLHVRPKRPTTMPQSRAPLLATRHRAGRVDYGHGAPYREEARPDTVRLCLPRQGSVSGVTSCLLSGSRHASYVMLCRRRPQSKSYTESCTESLSQKHLILGSRSNLSKPFLSTIGRILTKPDSKVFVADLPSLKTYRNDALCLFLVAHSLHERVHRIR